MLGKISADDKRKQADYILQCRLNEIRNACEFIKPQIFFPFFVN